MLEKGLLILGGIFAVLAAVYIYPNYEFIDAEAFMERTKTCVLLCDPWRHAFIREHCVCGDKHIYNEEYLDAWANSVSTFTRGK